MNGNEFLAAQLATVAYRDGFSEGLSGMLAVAFALRNRKDAGWYGGKWADIIEHHAEVSYRTDPFTFFVPDITKYSFQLFLQEVYGILTGQRVDNVLVAQDSIRNYISIGLPPKPAMYYGKIDQISNDWFLTNISRKPAEHPMVATVGALSFFA